MKKIYVCSRLAGDYEANTEAAREYSRYVMKECGAIAIAPHLLFPQFLDDSDPKDRKLGQEAGLELLESCDERRFGFAELHEFAHSAKLGLWYFQCQSGDGAGDLRREGNGYPRPVCAGGGMEQR